MTEISPGLALRQIQQAQAGLRKAREALRMARGPHGQTSEKEHALALGWEKLAQTFGVLAAIPLSAANDDVLTRELAISRYATALLVRLRRLVRNETTLDDQDHLDQEDEAD
jgi:hypothetical protein